MQRLIPLLGLAIVLAACGDGSAANTALSSTTASATSSPATSAVSTTHPTTTAPPTTAVSPTTAQGVVDVAVELSGGSVEITMAGAPVERRVRVEIGAAVRIEVTADVSDEVHLHGYDLLAHVSPEAPGVIELVADIPGIFEVELEGAHDLLFELEVS